MEPDPRSSAPGSTIRQRVLVLAAAALLTALLFGALFEGMAWVINWVRAGGFRGFEALPPWARSSITLVLPLIFMCTGMAVGFRRHRQRAKLLAYRRRTGF